MATILEAQQRIIDLIAAHDGGLRIDEGDDSYTQLGITDLARGLAQVTNVACDPCAPGGPGPGAVSPANAIDGIGFLC